MVNLSICKQALKQMNSLWQWRNSFCPYQCMLVVAASAETWNRGGLELVPTRCRNRRCGRKLASLVCLYQQSLSDHCVCQKTASNDQRWRLEGNWLLVDSYALRWIKGFSCLMHERHGWPKSHRDVRSQWYLCLPTTFRGHVQCLAYTSSLSILLLKMCRMENENRVLCMYFFP